MLSCAEMHTADNKIRYRKNTRTTVHTRLLTCSAAFLNLTQPKMVSGYAGCRTRTALYLLGKCLMLYSNRGQDEGTGEAVTVPYY